MHESLKFRNGRYPDLIVPEMALPHVQPIAPTWREAPFDWLFDVKSRLAASTPFFTAR